jgi:hypothetical protein
MKRFNVSVLREYEKDGEKKTAWGNVGKLVYFPATESNEEGFILELNMFPTTKFGVFPDKPKEARPTNDGIETIL